MSSPLYAPRIPQFFTGHVERTVLTPVESVSIEVRRSNGRLDTFSSATLFGQIGPGYVYGIFTSVHPVGVKGLASWRRTVVQSAREPHLFLGRTAREKPAERRRTERGSRGCGGEAAAAASVHWGLADSVAANIAHCPSSMAVCPAPLSVMISEKLVGMRLRVCVCERCTRSASPVLAMNLSLGFARWGRFMRPYMAIRNTP